MINASTFEKLKALNCGAMADEFRNQINDSTSYNSLGFEERLGLLVDTEWNRRQANKLRNLIKRAGFSISSACIENIEYLPDRKLDKAQLIRFSTCQYINEGHHIILKGASGSGKTYIACALGMQPVVNSKLYDTSECLNYSTNYHLQNQTESFVK